VRRSRRNGNTAWSPWLDHARPIKRRKRWRSRGLNPSNRRSRKRGAAWRETMERERQKWRAKIDEIFNRLARDFDPQVGTSASVQREAADAFAGIFWGGEL
jgi:hypothetical protein